MAATATMSLAEIGQLTKERLAHMQGENEELRSKAGQAEHVIRDLQRNTANAQKAARACQDAMAVYGLAEELMRRCWDAEKLTRQADLISEVRTKLKTAVDGLPAPLPDLPKR